MQPKELTATLLNPAPTALYAYIGTQQMQALHQLAAIFNTAVQAPQPPPRVKPIMVSPQLKTPTHHVILPDPTKPAPHQPIDRSPILYLCPRRTNIPKANPNQLHIIIPDDSPPPPRVMDQTSINQPHRYPTRYTQHADHATMTPLCYQPQFANAVVDK